jgi:signal transduction histidine kinase
MSTSRMGTASGSRSGMSIASPTPCATSRRAGPLDPEVVARVQGRRRHQDPPGDLTERELELRALMAEGRSNQAIADQLVVNERAVEKHVTRTFGKLGPMPATEDQRRVLAGPGFLRSQMENDQASVARLEALLAEQAALRRVATLVAGDPDAGKLFDAVCEEVGRVLGVESVNITRFEDDGTQTVVGAWAAGGAPWLPQGERVPLDGETVSGKLFRTGRPERVDDYSGVRGELVRLLREAGVASAVGAPVTVAGRTWGGIMASRGLPHAFPDGAEIRLAEFAELVTAALANVDAREQLAASRARIVQAGDEERRRLGRDLHDGAQQELISVVIGLKLAQRRLARAPDQAGELLEEALEHVETGIRELRELAAGIHPSVLTDRGLRAALEALAGRSPVPVELEEVSPPRLPGPVETSAYFVVSEALTNAAKHACCSHVSVGVQVEEGAVTVEVRDDGVGGADPSLGSGLRGLADRVNALGGGLEIQSPAGQGTTVRARIALHAPETGRDAAGSSPATKARPREGSPVS